MANESNDQPNAGGDAKETWLVAVWPGMGSVAVGAGGYLAQQKKAPLVHKIGGRELFEIESIDVSNGMASVGRLPRQLLFDVPNANPNRKADVLLMIGEAQPPQNGYALCHKILDYAKSRGVTKVFTFAAMATQLHPSDSPRVFGVSTDRQELSRLRERNVEILKEGQISGLNGVLLAAAAERKIPAICLLGELPFFAAGVPNPKASRAVLREFADLAGLDVDFTDLDEQSEAVEQGLIELLEKLRKSAREQQGASFGDEEGFTLPEFAQGDDEDEDEDEPENKLDLATRHRIEAMFAKAREDREKAFELKEELDRIGVFDQYEDRFLDLFKQAG